MKNLLRVPQIAVLVCRLCRIFRLCGLQIGLEILYHFKVATVLFSIEEAVIVIIPIHLLLDKIASLALCLDHSLFLSMNETVKAMPIICLFRDETKYRIERILCKRNRFIHCVQISIWVKKELILWIECSNKLCDEMEAPGVWQSVSLISQHLLLFILVYGKGIDKPCNHQTHLCKEQLLRGPSSIRHLSPCSSKRGK
jgi:hypothetical protein